MFDIHEIVGKFLYINIKNFAHLPEQFFEGDFSVIDSLYRVQGVYQFYPLNYAACPFQV
jgi:hypothetical protein